jgi:threonine/homoserine/homoserine lactone efflux protein
MPPIDALIAFIAAGLLLNITPGPDVLYIVGRSLGQGRAAGIVSALGIGAGCLFHIAAATLGLSALIMASPLAYDVIRYAGGGYPVWLGIRAVLSRSSPLKRPLAATRPAEAPLGRIFWQGVVTNILNPKVALFFLAFLPQFADPARGPLAPQIGFLGIVFDLDGTLVCIAWALLASRLGLWLRSRYAVGRWLNRAMGVMFIGIGLKLALARR